MGNILCEIDFLGTNKDSKENIVSVANDCQNDKSENEDNSNKEILNDESEPSLKTSSTESEPESEKDEDKDEAKDEKKRGRDLGNQP